MIIYKTTNLINGKFYVGKDVNDNAEYLGSGVILEKAIQKYGRESFKKETIQRCNTLKELNEQEVYWIGKLNATDRRIGYNIALGGDGGDIFNQLTPSKQREAIRKSVENSKEIRNSAEFKRKKSEKASEMWQRDGFREKVSNALTGREIGWKSKIRDSIRKHWKTRSHVVSEETRQRISESSKGKVLKSLGKEIEKQILDLYQVMGPKLIEKQLGVSRYLIIRFLKQTGTYQKWQKGIGDKSKKTFSISRRIKRLTSPSESV